MSLNNPEYAPEITRQETRLNSLRSEVADLVKEKGIHDTDIEKKTKHLAYLDELQIQKDAELERKGTALKALDEEITDKQALLAELSLDVKNHQELIETSREELGTSRDAIRDHEARIAKETAASHAKTKENEEKQAWHDERVKKMKEFLKDLN